MQNYVLRHCFTADFGLKSETITAKAGAKMKETFTNNDGMFLNLVFTKQGDSSEVGELALKMGLDGQKLNYVTGFIKSVISYISTSHKNAREERHIATEDSYVVTCCNTCLSSLHLSHLTVDI